jgi:hypothetical protein
VYTPLMAGEHYHIEAAVDLPLAARQSRIRSRSASSIASHDGK